MKPSVLVAKGLPKRFGRVIDYFRLSITEDCVPISVITQERYTTGQDFVGVDSKTPLVSPNYLAGFHCRPQISEPVFKQADEPIAGKTWSVALVEDCKAHAVETS
jgi:hypothetical protein